MRRVSAVNPDPFSRDRAEEGRDSYLLAAASSRVMDGAWPPAADLGLGGKVVVRAAFIGVTLSAVGD